MVLECMRRKLSLEDIDVDMGHERLARGLNS